MFGAILQHFMIVLGSTLKIFWIAIDVIFQIVASQFTSMFEKVTLQFNFSKLRGCSLMMSCFVGGVWTPLPPLSLKITFWLIPPPPLINENHFLSLPSHYMKYFIDTKYILQYFTCIFLCIHTFCIIMYKH